MPGRSTALLGEEEGYLWPQAVNHAALAGAELAATWPRRTDVPGHLWTDLLRAARRTVDVLAFAGLFLAEEHSGWLPALADKAGTDCRVRLLLGDPAGRQLAARNLEYSIGGGVAGRVSAVLSYYRQLPAGWSCGCTTPRCTTRSTGSTTRCWSTCTSTGSWPRTRR